MAGLPQAPPAPILHPSTYVKINSITSSDRTDRIVLDDPAVALPINLITSDNFPDSRDHTTPIGNYFRSRDLGILPYKCCECGSSFNTDYKLQRHRALQHMNLDFDIPEDDSFYRHDCKFPPCDFFSYDENLLEDHYLGFHVSLMDTETSDIVPSDEIPIDLDALRNTNPPEFRRVATPIPSQSNSTDPPMEIDVESFLRAIPADFRIEKDSYRSNTCPLCDIKFVGNGPFFEHLYLDHPSFYTNYQVGSGIEKDEEMDVSETSPALILTNTNHGGIVKRFSADLKELWYDDIDEFLSDIQPSVDAILRNELKLNKSTKAFFGMGVNFYKYIDGVYTETHGWFISFQHIILNTTMLPRMWDDVVHQMDVQIDKYTCEKSGWIIESVGEFELVTNKYEPLRIGTYIKTPFPLNDVKRNSVFNVDNSQSVDGNKHCFLFSILAAEEFLGEKAFRKGCDLKKILERQKHVKVDGLNFPMTLDQLPLFHKLNPNIGLTILSHEITEANALPPGEGGSKMLTGFNRQLYAHWILCKSLELLYNCKELRPIQIDLLLLMNDEGSHFISIRNLDTLLRHPKMRYHRFICRNCLNGFRSVNGHKEHLRYCAARGLQKTVLPSVNHRVYFKSWQRTIPLPFRFYADFEALVPTLDTEPSTTQKVQQHHPSGYSWFCVDNNNRIIEGKVYRAKEYGDNVGTRFIKDLLSYTETLELVMLEYQKQAKKTMNIDVELLKKCHRENKCCFCEEEFRKVERRHRHHSHLPPYNFVGLAHENCNRLGQAQVKFPVFLHNMSSYDSHFIVKALGTVESLKNTIIPKSSEKFLSICLNGKINILDSLGFTMKSLDTLVKVKAESGGSFPLMMQYFSGKGDVSLLLQKGIFPYSYMKDFSNFTETELPPKEAFYNDLSEEHITESQYAHAQKVWTSFGCKNLGDYQDLYVMTDVLLLADIIEDRRQLMLDAYNLDLTQYYSLPMLAWDGVLKKSKVQLQCVSDATMHCWLESSIRGGYVGTGSTRYAEANNKYMKDKYKKDKDSTYILYIDANNLYGKAMSSALPIGQYEWVGDGDLDKILEDPERFIMDIGEDASHGYMFECDLTINESDHDKFSDFPPMPIKRKISYGEVSTGYQNPIMQDLHMDTSIFKMEKLVCDLINKENYVLHYRALQSYLKMGVKLGKVHKVLRFTQSRWMKSFIDFNTDMRKKATTEFEKDFWKLLNNSAFGKTIEQVRNRQNVRVVTTAVEALKYIKKPTVQYVRPVHGAPDTTIFLMKRLQVTLNKPIAVGIGVLEIAKSIMYDMHYGCIQPKYGDKAMLVYTDTDSFIYHIKTNDIYEDMKEDNHHFDMSEYDPAHPYFGKFHNPTNKKVLGKFKDEYANKIITKVCAPKAKMYSVKAIKFEKQSDGYIPGETVKELKSVKMFVNKAKGIGRVAIKKQITFAHYKDVIARNVQTHAKMRCIRSLNHNLYTIVMTKRALNGFDSKRYYCDNFTSLPYGHKNIHMYE